MSKVNEITDNLAISAKAVYVIESTASKGFSAVSKAFDKKTTDIAPSEDNTEKDAGGWQNWGDDNDLPATLWAKVSKSSLPLRMFEDLARLHFGGGLYYYTRKIVDGEEIREKAIDEKVDEWLRKNRIQLQYANTIIRDYYVWKTSPVEVVIDQTNKKILKAKAHDAAMVRWGDKNEKGVIDKAFLSANWPSPKDEQVKELPVIDPFNVEESIKAANKGSKKATNFIYPISEMTTLRMYYPLQQWATENSLNWLLVSMYTPIFYKALMENIMTLSYIIYINESFWPARYPKWEDMTPKEKVTAKDATFKKIEEVLSGAEKAGKFITSGYLYDDDGNKIKGIEVEAIENKINDKAFLMTNATANAELAYAWGYDPSLMGQGVPGGKELSGSGSEKMRSLQNKQILMASDRIVTLDFMHFVSMYMGWDFDWDFSDRVPTTLDQNKNGETSKPETNANKE